ncbi:MAG: c-type cytochrome [Desulfarculaceae bacterium]|nr:c-type cytochrome [Desulfarculaceae bacterium]MCF8072303.1 c-type cytochrome [Desulfarculaceae bacterium]MCF8100224.1 c-type cytochrome [Desulfarculaceae bacterium]MCF8116203.1 c-type cytochrome [Desulfarculaceae bacterium]
MNPERRFLTGHWLVLAGVLAGALALAMPASGGSATQGGAFPTSGKALYQKACMACHGPDGKGEPAERLGFEPLPPSFTDCSFATREANRDWLKVSQEGGPARGFNRIMPAFGGALSKEQLVAVINYTRHFCRDKRWPRGELNLPRPMFTTKAFPEDEAGIQSVYDTSDPGGSVKNKVFYETRIGPRGQLEITVPYNWVEVSDPGGGTTWQNGLGDSAISYKQVLYASLDTGAIVALGGEVILPTGDQDKGLGKGTSRFEPYVAYGQILPAQFFFEFQGGGAIPYDGAKANEEVFGRLAVGRCFYTGQYGRRWTPMVELLASKEMVSGEDTQWDVAPQFQVTLSARQHVRLGLAARIPLSQTDTRDVQYGLYLVWDWFDGGLFEGW